MNHLYEDRNVLSIPGDFPLRLGKVRNHGDRSLHRHYFSELVIVVQGQSTHVTPDEIYMVKKGDIFVVPPGISHGYRTDPDECFSIINVMFRFDQLKLPFFDLKKSPGFRMLFEWEPEISSRCGGRHFPMHRHLSLNSEMLGVIMTVLDRLEIALNDHRSGHQFRAVALFMELISRLADYFSSFPMDEPENLPLMRLFQVLDFMDRNFVKPLYISELARMSSMSESNFYRIFTALTGMSAEKYLIRLRLSHADILLRNTMLPIADVAAQSGFDDSNYFSRIFRRTRGCSPREYRKRMKTQAKMSRTDLPGNADFFGSPDINPDCAR